MIKSKRSILLTIPSTKAYLECLNFIRFSRKITFIEDLHLNSKSMDVINHTDAVPVDFDEINPISLKNRKNKVSVKDFASIPNMEMNCDINSFPDILAGKEVKEVVSEVIRAKSKGKPVVFAIGAHVIKCGLSSWIIHLMDIGIIDAVVMNGAAAIHDFEIALIGETSENVSEGLRDGNFGMAKETSSLMLEACMREEVHSAKMGMGLALGSKILELNSRYLEFSILAQAVKLKKVITVHTAIGAEIIYMHSSEAGMVFGQASGYDFSLLPNLIGKMGGGGVYFNIGSAVILPEVFLKAFALALNLKFDLRGMVTVNLDMANCYRPLENVIARPENVGTRGYALNGRHELLIPLLGIFISQKMR